jgi:hypothetical protein
MIFMKISNEEKRLKTEYNKEILSQRLPVVTRITVNTWRFSSHKTFTSTRIGRKTDTKPSHVRVFVNCCLIIFTFFLVWTPYIVLLLFAQFKIFRPEYITSTTVLIISLIGMSSVLMNPINYALKNK